MVIQYILLSLPRILFELSNQQLKRKVDLNNLSYFKFNNHLMFFNIHYFQIDLTNKEQLRTPGLARMSSINITRSEKGA